MSQMNKCNEIAPIIDLVICGQATQQQCDAVMEHIGQCCQCRQLYEMMWDIENSLPESVTPPENFTQTVMDAIMESDITFSQPPETKKKQQRKKYTVRYVAAAACILLVMSVAVKLAVGNSTSSDTADSVTAMATGSDENNMGSGAADTAPESVEGSESMSDGAASSADGDYTENIYDYDADSAYDQSSDTIQSESQTSNVHTDEEKVKNDYDAVVTITGQLPELLSDYDRIDCGEFYLIEIDLELLPELADLGYDVDYSGEVQSAAVIYIP